MVRRDERGGYRLGRRLLGLAARVAAQAEAIDLGTVRQPHLDRLAADLGAGVKLSVLDADGVLVAALSVPFLAGARAARGEAIRRAVIEAARTIGAALPGRSQPRRSSAGAGQPPSAPEP